jgi:hypothetical protein
MGDPCSSFPVSLSSGCWNEESFGQLVCQIVVRTVSQSVYCQVELNIMSVLILNCSHGAQSTSI